MHHHRWFRIVLTTAARWREVGGQHRSTCASAALSVRIVRRRSKRRSARSPASRPRVPRHEGRERRVRSSTRQGRGHSAGHPHERLHGRHRDNAHSHQEHALQLVRHSRRARIADDARCHCSPGQSRHRTRSISNTSRSAPISRRSAQAIEFGGLSRRRAPKPEPRRRDA